MPAGRPPADLTGKRFGQLQVLRAVPERSPGGSVQWACRCACGTEVVRDGAALRRGRHNVCSVSAPQHRVPPRASRLDRTKFNIAGQRFGYLTALRSDTPHVGYADWLCRCDCGNSRTISRHDLVTENNCSCGCIMRRCEPGDGIIRPRIRGHSAMERAAFVGRVQLAIAAKIRTLATDNFNNSITAAEFLQGSVFVADRSRRPARARKSASTPPSPPPRP